MALDLSDDEEIGEFIYRTSRTAKLLREEKEKGEKEDEKKSSITKDNRSSSHDNLLPINIKIKEEYDKVKAEDDSTDDERSPEYITSSSSGYDPVKSEETDDEDTDKSNSHENINIKEEAAKTEEDSDHYYDDTDQEDEVEVKTEEDSDHAYDEDTDNEELDEDTNNTSNEQLPIKVKPDDVSTDDEHGNEMKEAKKRRKMSLQEEEEEERDDEGFRDMDMQGRKRIKEKVKPPLKTEEVPTDNEDEEMADDKSSSGTTKPADGQNPPLICLDVGTNPFPPLNHFISSDTEDSDEVVVVEQEKEVMPSSNRRSSQLPVSANQFKVRAQRSRKKRKAPPSEVEENSSGSVQKAVRGLCSGEGCNRKALDSGTCWKHKGYKYCSQDRCTSRALKGGVCIRHEEFAIKKVARYLFLSKIPF